MYPALPLRTLLARLSLISAAVLIVGYGAFEARRIIEGPAITLTSPRNGTSVMGPTVHIEGTARNTAFISINDKQVYVDQYGHFDEVISPPPGFAALTIAATDRFGRRNTRTVEITIADYCPVRAAV